MRGERRNETFQIVGVPSVHQINVVRRARHPMEDGGPTTDDHAADLVLLHQTKDDLEGSDHARSSLDGAGLARRAAPRRCSIDE